MSIYCTWKMKRMAIIAIGMCCLCTPSVSQAQQVLTLDECRNLAIENNKQLQVLRLQQQIAKDSKDAAQMLYFPNLDVNAGYVHTSREISILNDRQKSLFSNLGTSLTTAVGQGAPNLLTALAQQGIITPAQAQGLLQVAAQSLPQLAQQLNQIGQEVIDAFHTDTRNIWLGSVTLTQPLYTGGKITAANKMASINQELVANQMEEMEHSVALNVDKAYWLVVSLYHKQQLAEAYHALLQQLEQDVQKMVREGVATKADELSVNVKVNEAEMTLTQVSDGLTLSRMALCQLCGLPVNTEPTLYDEQHEELQDDGAVPMADMANVLANRPEMKMLSNACDIAEQKLKMTRANYFPTLALTAGYTLSNPNVYNSFQKKFGGMWDVGLVLSVPVSNIWENRPKMSSARANAQIYQVKKAEAESLIDLEVQQNQFKLNEARKKLQMTEKNIASANENLRSANTGFAEGVFTATTVMEAQTAWLKAKSQNVDAQIDVKLAAAELRKSLGEVN